MTERHEVIVTQQFEFCFDTKVIVNLACVICRCRSLAIRRKAKSLLENYPRREGVWDSSIITAFSEALSGYLNGFIEIGLEPGPSVRLRIRTMPNGLSLQTYGICGAEGGRCAAGFEEGTFLRL